MRSLQGSGYINKNERASSSQLRQHSYSKKEELDKMEKEFEEKYGKTPYSVISSINTHWKFIKPGTIANQVYRTKFESKNRDMIVTAQKGMFDSSFSPNNQSLWSNSYQASKFDNKSRHDISTISKQKVDTECSQELELDLCDETFTKTFDGR